MRALLFTILGSTLPLGLLTGAWWAWSGPALSGTAGPPVVSASASAPAAARGTHKPPAASQPEAFTPAATRPAAFSAGELIDAWRQRLETAARENPELQESAATILLQQGRYGPALKAFDRLLRQRPNDTAILLGKALALTGLGRHEDALPLFATLARVEADSLPTRYGYAVALMRCGEHAEAAEAFEAVLRHQPGHVRARFNLAILHQAAGRRLRALDLWRQITDSVASAPAGATPDPAKVDPSLTLTPQMLADAWFHRGEMALESHHLQEAETCFLRLTERSPQDAAAWCNLGIVRARQFRRDEAVAALGQALRCNPRLVPALNQMAYIQAANFRDTGVASYADAVLDLCRRSLAVEPDQANVRALQRAILSAEVPDEGESDRQPDG